MFSGIGTFEMMLFGVVALLLFGAKLPEVARNLGGTYRGLKRSVVETKHKQSINSSLNRWRTINHYVQ